MTDTHTIILADDGRWLSIGRNGEPSGLELATAAAALVAQGVGAWLCTMHGNPYAKRAPKITMIRELAPSLRPHGQPDSRLDAP